MDERKVRGTVVNAYLKPIKKKWGVQGVEDALKYAGFKSPPKDSEWVSALKAEKILEWVAETKGKEYVKYVGAGSISEVGAFRNLLTSFMGFDKVVKKAPDSYNNMFNFGSIKVSFDGDMVDIYMKDAVVNEYTADARLGSIESIVKSTKAGKKVRMVEADSPNDLHFILEPE